MNKITFCLFLFVLAGCNVVEKKSPTVFFAGEIVNPTNNYVLLYKGEKAIDSSKLDANNRFAIKLDSADEGLYYFVHFPEHQYIYLQKGDSLMMRLNTMDFDESLVFSGKGEEINNFLMELFLANEKEKYLINASYYSLEPEKFMERMDSLRASKMQMLHDLESEITLSKKALDVANASINYSNYIFREKYPFEHKRRTGEKSLQKLPDSFYNYRKNVSFNDRNLTYLRPYYYFMKNHVGNLSYMDCLRDCENHKNSGTQLHFNTHKLEIIDSLVQEKELKDNLFRNVALDYLLKAHDSIQNNSVFIKEFHKYSGNNKHIKEIDELYRGITNMQPGRQVPALPVYAFDDQKISLQKISAKNKTVVFYFWSGEQKDHFTNITNRVKWLKTRYPKYTFVGISLKTDPLKWKSMVESKKLDKACQFRAVNSHELANTLILSDANKAIITKDGVIVNAFANVNGSL